VKILSAKYLRTEGMHDVFETTFDTGIYELRRSRDNTHLILAFEAPHEFYTAADEAMLKMPNLDEHRAMMSEIFKTLEKEHPIART
jgi:hypothetical protein